MATSFAFQPIVTDGLIMRVDPLSSKSYNGVSNIVTDIVNNKQFTFVGSPTYSGRSLYFNGNSLTSTVIDTGQNFSGFAWIKPSIIPQRNSIMASSYNYTGRNGWLFMTGDGYGSFTNMFWLTIGSDTVYVGTSNNSLRKNIWTQVGFSVQNGGQNVKLYVNGAEVTNAYSVLSSGTITYTLNEFNIGGRYSGSEPFYGNISDCTLYNRVLSTSEILQNYNATKWRFEEHPIVEDGLVFYVDPKNTSSYPGTGTSVTSLVGSQTGTLLNGVTYDNISFGFDGSNDRISFTNTNYGTIHTFDIWAKFNAYNSVLWGRTTVPEYVIYVESATSVYYSANGNYINFALSVPIPLDKYTHIVMARSGSNIYLYINGILSSSLNSASGNMQVSTIGGYDTGAYPFSGNVSVAKIYNRLLTPTEVLQNYTATKNRFL